MARCPYCAWASAQCKDGAIVALHADRSGAGDRGLIQLPQSIIYPTPAAPSPMPPTTSNLGQTDCASLGLTAPTCTASGNMTIDAQGNTMLFGSGRERGRHHPP